MSTAPVQARPQRGDELELQIDSLAFGGEGVARLGDSGYVVFVAGAIPGDRVRAVVHKRKRSYAHARTLEVLAPSPERIAPRRRAPGRRVAGDPLRAPARDQARTGPRGARAARRSSSGFDARGDRPGGRSNGATATSSSTRSATAPTARSCAASTRPAGGNAVRGDGGLPARLRARQPRARARGRLVSRRRA